MNVNFAYKNFTLLRRCCFPSRICQFRNIQDFPSTCLAKTQTNSYESTFCLESPLYLRKTYEALSQWEVVRLAGVTFEGRQVNLSGRIYSSAPKNTPQLQSAQDVVHTVIFACVIVRRL
jgi:hypothetical protein